MRVIRTRYISATNYRQSRIIATDAFKNQVTVNYDDALNSGENHEAAAQKLMEKMGWPNKLVSGNFGNDVYFVMLPLETSAK